MLIVKCSDIFSPFKTPYLLQSHWVYSSYSLLCLLVHLYSLLVPLAIVTCSYHSLFSPLLSSAPRHYIHTYIQTSTHTHIISIERALLTCTTLDSVSEWCRILELFPKLLSVIATREKVPIDDINWLKGSDFKSQILNKLCSNRLVYAFHTLFIHLFCSWLGFIATDS